MIHIYHLSRNSLRYKQQMYHKVMKGEFAEVEIARGAENSYDTRFQYPF